MSLSIAILWALLGTAHAGNPTPTTNVPIGPDVFVTDIHQTADYGRFGGISAFSIGTVSCNAGDDVLQWIASTPAHPVIAQNMYRLKAGRFEQIGMSWVKHAFNSLNQAGCGLACVPPGTGALMGVGCSDPYAATTNGTQAFLGPRSEINAATGVFPYPPILDPSTSLIIDRRLQVHDADLDPTQLGGGDYFVEGQYITADDAAAGNGKNNASYKPVTVSFNGTASRWQISVAGQQVQTEQAAIHAWRASDPSVTETQVDVPGDGRFTLAAKAVDLGGGLWQYEYALHNLDSDRAGASFSVPIDPTGTASGLGFHDVDYHSGEPFDGTDWAAVIFGGRVTWSTEDFTVNPNANALRWGTLYNFRFQANLPPSATNVTLKLFKPGTPTEVEIATIGPLLNAGDCNGNGIADSLDIAAGTSRDCNANGFPDECEVFPETPITAIRVATGLIAPVFVTSPPGDANRLFIVEQSGRIKILTGGNVLPTPFLSIGTRVAVGGERGLLSMAFDPNYSNNGFFCVNYTNLAGDTVISRFAVSVADANVADFTSEVILKTITQDSANHNGGQLQFGADGFLYVGMGDGGITNDGNNRAQDPSSLLGKMLRLDTNNPPTYVAAGNPFVGAGLPLDEIWASGLRNPWRFSFDRQTHDLYIADVGEDAVEEVDFQPTASLGGENYGWSCMEGLTCTGSSVCTCNDPSLTPPVLTYPHDTFACSITGGYVYRGCAMPDLSGTYFYADFCANFIRSFRYVGGLVTGERDRTAQLTPAGGAITSIVSFGEDAAGELYIVSHAGSIYKIVPDASGSICGNGVLEPGEQCDDGNTTPGDGCDENCQADPNDACVDARAVSEGAFSVNTFNATTDGPDEPALCGFAGDTQVNSDVWYCYTPSCTGTATISLCGSTFNTKLAVYDGCTCPVAESATACDDDTCGLQSELTIPVSACGSVLVRVGGFGAEQGIGTLNIACDPNPITVDCNGNGLDDAVDIACGTSLDADGNGVPDECETGGDYVRGGKLYDRWWTATQATPPITDHPLWAFRPDDTSNSSVGSATWRCKECHGWDYKGVDGQYGTGPHRTGFPGVLGTLLDAAQLRTLLKEPPSSTGGPGVSNGHDYGSVMSDVDVNDLVSFLLLGAMDDDPFIDPTTTEFRGDAAMGETNFTSAGSPSCIVCHGINGTEINFGTAEDREYLGTVAVENPWEFLHKVRVGQPGAPMPSWLEGGKTNQGAADIGLYAQLNFPTECISDGQCDDAVACTNDSCDADGRCVNAPMNANCTDSGLFCDGAEVCDPLSGCISTGNPCLVPGACDEVSDDCGCAAPLVSTGGARYLMVTPQAFDASIPMALLVTPACPAGVTRYVGVPAGPSNVAILVDNPSLAARLTESEWGAPVAVKGLDIVPSQGYFVRADCALPGSSRPTLAASTTTSRFGDTAGTLIDGAWTPPDGIIDVQDITAQLDAFEHRLAAPSIFAADQRGCLPDGIIDVLDILSALDGFRGDAFEIATRCKTPCP